MSLDATSIPANLRRANVTLIVDAMPQLGLDVRKFVMETGIGPLSLPEGRTVIGRALTTGWEVGRGRMTAESVDRYIYGPLDAASPGSVWVVAGGTGELYSLFGDIIAMACRRNGMGGAVTDNGCRDIAAIRAMGFPVFARGAVPYGPGDAIRPVSVNEEIVCGGVLVQPGDLVAADIDGVIVIPGKTIDELDKAVAERAAVEDESRRKIEGGRSLTDSH